MVNFDDNLLLDDAEPVGGGDSDDGDLVDGLGEEEGEGEEEKDWKVSEAEKELDE
ncbi:hypothetical protein HYS99_00495 [Candidatus Giovannonibacteria bacterium]|nr:hypothetical protein [Candidatus Giovannonibacteria bacterium]